MMNRASGTINNAAHRYVNHTASRRPKMLNAHTAMIVPIAMKCGRPRWLEKIVTVHVEFGHHCAVARSPMILPKIDSTTDQPIQ